MVNGFLPGFILAESDGIVGSNKRKLPGLPGKHAKGYGIAEAIRIGYLVCFRSK